ncbi:hypothetical protein D3C80_1469760 [compost metagenome]
MVKAAILGLPVGRARHLAIPVRRGHQQIVAPRGKGRYPQPTEGIQHYGGGDALVITGLARHEGEAAVAEIVKHGPAPAAAPRQGHAILFHAAGVALLPRILRPAYHHRIGVAPQEEHPLGGIHLAEDALLHRQVEQGILRVGNEQA